jgi:hypothetical protein
MTREREGASASPTSGDATSGEKTKVATGSQSTEPATETAAVQGTDKPQAKVSADRRTHILDGDGTGGGHRHGSGILGKSEFPVEWSDNKIINEIESVANDPASSRTVQPNGRTRVEGTREGVDIRVIVDPDGASIRTAHPVNR